MTRSRLMGTYLSHPVPKNLTTHRMSKIEFQPDFRNPQMLTFLNMCNTMGSKMDGLAVRELKPLLLDIFVRQKIFPDRPM